MQGGMSTDLRSPSIALLFLLLPPGITIAGAQVVDRNGKLNPSVAIIIAALIAVVVFTGFISVYFRRCSGDRGTVWTALVGYVGGRGRRSGGVDSAALEAMPAFLFSDVKELEIGIGALECAVCLNEFGGGGGEILRLLSRCDHAFHVDCIDAWLASHTTCPVCRTNLAPDTTRARPVHAPPYWRSKIRVLRSAKPRHSCTSSRRLEPGQRSCRFPYIELDRARSGPTGRGLWGVHPQVADAREGAAAEPEYEPGRLFGDVSQGKQCTARPGRASVEVGPVGVIASLTTVNAP